MRKLSLLGVSGAFAALLFTALSPWMAWGQAAKPAAGRTAPRPKWDNHILRLFFADATKEVGPGQPGSNRPAPGTIAGATAATSGSPGGPANLAGGFSWSKLIDAETLEGEIKTNINALTTAVDNPNKFKAQNFRKARGSFSELAVLFGVVAEYDGEVKWKDKGAGLRDGLAKAGFNCKVGTEQSYIEAKARYEDLRSMLDGGTLKLSDAEPTAEWAKVADRSELMKRMEEAGQNRLTPWTSSEGDFKANRDKVLEEAQLLAVMSQVIQHKSFESGEDETYLKYAASLQQACLEIIDGAKQGAFDKARGGAGSMAKACADCHTDFR